MSKLVDRVVTGVAITTMFVGILYIVDKNIRTVEFNEHEYREVLSQSSYIMQDLPQDHGTSNLSRASRDSLHLLRVPLEKGSQRRLNGNTDPNNIGKSSGR